VSVWPGRPATECERCARCGNDDLNDSRRSSFGFCELVLDGRSVGSGRAGTRAADSACAHHSTLSSRAPVRGGGEAHRLRNIASWLEGAGRVVAWAHREAVEVGTLGEDYQEVVMNGAGFPEGQASVQATGL
jgi:hypothetical protein